MVAILANWDVVPGGQLALIAWPAAILVCAVVGAVIGVMAVRTTGVHFIMITLAFAEMIYFLFQSVEAFGGNDGLSFRRRDALPWLNMRDDTVFYYVCLVLLVAFVALCRRMMRARFGLALQGIRQNPRRMAALGLHTGAYRLAAFTIAAAGAGLAGALYANLLRFVSPDMLHWTTSGDLTAMVVLGGAGSLYRPGSRRGGDGRAATVSRAMDRALDDPARSVPGAASSCSRAAGCGWCCVMLGCR